MSLKCSDLSQALRFGCSFKNYSVLLLTQTYLSFWRSFHKGVRNKTLKPWPPLTTKAPCELTPLCTEEIKCYAFFHTFLMSSYVWPHSAVSEAQDPPEPLNSRGITQIKMGHTKNRLQSHWEAGWYHFECPWEGYTVQCVIPNLSSRQSGQPLGEREKVRNKLRRPSWVKRKIVTSVLEKNLHNLPCEIISDIG